MPSHVPTHHPGKLVAFLTLAVTAGMLAHPKAKAVGAHLTSLHVAVPVCLAVALLAAWSPAVGLAAAVAATAAFVKRTADAAAPAVRLPTEADAPGGTAPFVGMPAEGSSGADIAALQSARAPPGAYPIHEPVPSDVPRSYAVPFAPADD
jgi:hypothetical protein